MCSLKMSRQLQLVRSLSLNLLMPLGLLPVITERKGNMQTDAHHLNLGGKKHKFCTNHRESCSLTIPIRRRLVDIDCFKFHSIIQSWWDLRWSLKGKWFYIFYDKESIFHRTSVKLEKRKLTLLLTLQVNSGFKSFSTTQKKKDYLICKHTISSWPMKLGQIMILMTNKTTAL